MIRTVAPHQEVATAAVCALGAVLACALMAHVLRERRESRLVKQAQSQHAVYSAVRTQEAW